MAKDPKSNQEDPNPGSLFGDDPEGRPAKPETTPSGDEPGQGGGAQAETVESLKAKYETAEKRRRDLESEFTPLRQKLKEQERILSSLNANQFQAGNSTPHNPNFFDDPIGNARIIARNEAVNTFRQQEFARAVNKRMADEPEEFNDLKPYMLYAEQQRPEIMGNFEETWKAGKKYRDEFEDKTASRLAARLGIDEEAVKAKIRKEAEGRALAAGASGGGSTPPKPKEKKSDAEETIDRMSELGNSNF